MSQTVSERSGKCCLEVTDVNVSVTDGEDCWPCLLLLAIDKLVFGEHEIFKSPAVSFTIC